MLRIYNSDDEERIKVAVEHQKYILVNEKKTDDYQRLNLILFIN